MAKLISLLVRSTDKKSNNPSVLVTDEVVKKLSNNTFERFVRYLNEENKEHFMLTPEAAQAIIKRPTTLSIIHYRLSAQLETFVRKYCGRTEVCQLQEY